MLHYREIIKEMSSDFTCVWESVYRVEFRLRAYRIAVFGIFTCAWEQVGLVIMQHAIL